MVEKKHYLTIFWPLLFVFLLVACSSGDGKAAGIAEEEVTMTIELTSPAFVEGSAIPAKYSCDGDDISPGLEWRNLPAGTESLALIMDDPDAPVGVWDHWVLYDLPAGSAGLPENVLATGDEQGGGTMGSNSWGRSGYGGPCPPGGTHRYFFKLYALDTALGLEPGASKDEVLKAMEGHILDQGQLMGTYQR